MANEEHLEILRKGVKEWNRWRETNAGADLTYAGLRAVNLRGANLHGVDLSRANLSNAQLIDANLRDAQLIDADLHHAHLTATSHGRFDQEQETNRWGRLS